MFTSESSCISGHSALRRSSSSSLSSRSGSALRVVQAYQAPVGCLESFAANCDCSPRSKPQIPAATVVAGSEARLQRMASGSAVNSAGIPDDHDRVRCSDGSMARWHSFSQVPVSAREDPAGGPRRAQDTLSAYTRQPSLTAGWVPSRQEQQEAMLRLRKPLQVVTQKKSLIRCEAHTAT
jgi:hypothetical protein